MCTTQDYHQSRDHKIINVVDKTQDYQSRDRKISNVDNTQDYQSRDHITGSVMEDTQDYISTDHKTGSVVDNIQETTNPGITRSVVGG